MRIFFSVGEPSGDLHAANLIHALRRLQPDVDCVGFGGERMQSAGCELIYNLCQHAVMGVARVLTGAVTFVRQIARANRFFRERRPDAVVLVDYPGFNWWIARRAHAHGIPVFYFVPPQLWAWAGWRIKKMRRNVDHILCTLPFEQAWYKDRGVDAHYVGHPFFDDLQQQSLDSSFLESHRQIQAPIIGLLPGSRDQEVERNWSMQYRAAARIHQARPEVRFLTACFKPHQKQRIDEYSHRHAPLPIETCVGRTPEIIELSRACITVSGSVALELLWRAKPSTIIYRLDRVALRFCRAILNVPHICLVNLLAGKDGPLRKRCRRGTCADVVEQARRVRSAA
jgi:lipid-A-disaccharide synthase